MLNQTNQTPWYHLQLKDFIPFYGLDHYNDRVPKEKSLGLRDIINTYAIIFGQVAILTGIAAGIKEGLERIL